MTCAFSSKRQEYVKVLVEEPGRSPVEIDRPEYVDVPCTNEADGENGFCKHHSYPILKAIYYMIEEVVEQNVHGQDGELHTTKKKSKSNRIFNQGEHANPDEISKERLQLYIESGHIGIRKSMTEVVSNRFARTLDDTEIDELTSRPVKEVLNILNVETYCQVTLAKIGARSASKKVQDEVNSQLG